MVGLVYMSSKVVVKFTGFANRVNYDIQYNYIKTINKYVYFKAVVDNHSLFF